MYFVLGIYTPQQDRFVCIRKKKFVCVDISRNYRARSQDSTDSGAYYQLTPHSIQPLP